MLKIGFDFDGVLVYNPLRLARLPVALFKSKFLKKRKLAFWYPQKEWQKVFWYLLHKSSLFPANGYNRLLDLMKEEKIEGYVITGRYSFLEEDFHKLLAKYDPEKLFKEYYLNRRDEQPHKFKERMIRKLKLDYFLEDNWDIVNYLSLRFGSSGSRFKVQGSRKSGLERRASNLERDEVACKIHWIYNMLDRKIDYPNKHPYLAKFLQELDI